MIELTRLENVLGPSFQLRTLFKSPASTRTTHSVSRISGSEPAFYI